MALPRIDTPIYDLELPLSKKKIRFRPFLVKEQKNLLMALEANDRESIESNIKQVLYNCTLTDNIEIDKLPVVDIEYYFLQLRARSVGEIVENRYRCDNIVDEKTCGNIMESQVNLLDFKVTDLIENDDIIELTDKITIKLKYPEFSVINKVSSLKTSTEVAFRMIAESIDYIYDGEQFYYARETSIEELIEFLESLNQQQFNKIENFFTNSPKIEKKIKITCSKCGFNHNLEVEGLENFFG